MDEQLGRRSKILVVDACAVSGKATHQLLHSIGHPMVDYSKDGPTALKLIGQKDYHLILADWDVATANGMDLLGQTRANYRFRSLPFLMAIHRWQKKFIEIVREDGATLYMIKPFSGETLRERMSQVYVDASKLRPVRVAPMIASAQVATRTAANSDLWKMLRSYP